MKQIIFLVAVLCLNFCSSTRGIQVMKELNRFLYDNSDEKVHIMQEIKSLKYSADNLIEDRNIKTMVKFKTNFSFDFGPYQTVPNRS